MILESQPIWSVLPNGSTQTAPHIHVLRQWEYGPGTYEVIEMDVDASQDGTAATGAGDARYFYDYDSAATSLDSQARRGISSRVTLTSATGRPVLIPADSATNIKSDGTDRASTGTYGSDPNPHPHGLSDNL